MSNQTEGTIILKTQFEKKLNNNKSDYKIINLKDLLYFFFFFVILIIIGIFIFAFFKINYMNHGIISDAQYKKILQLINNLNDKISYLEKEILKKKKQMIKLKDINNIYSNDEIFNITDENYDKIGIFNQNINEKYINSQNYFCNNQNIFYNKIFEDRIKLIDIIFNDKKFNMFVYSNSDIVSNYIIKDKAWEVIETQNLLKALNYYSNKKNINKKDIYIIDIGANIGWYSFILGKYGYNIISFEPSKINNYILKKNYCLNKEINITIINKGLFNEEKKCYLYNDINNEGNGFIECDLNHNLSTSFKKTGEIVLTKLSNYLPFFNNKNLILIKMDIEGAERNAIDGGIEFITKYHVPFIFFEFSPTYLKRLNKEPKEFLQLFVDNGYKISVLDFFSNHTSVDNIMKKNIFQINLYLVYSKILE